MTMLEKSLFPASFFEIKASAYMISEVRIITIDNSELTMLFIPCARV